LWEEHRRDVEARRLGGEERNSLFVDIYVALKVIPGPIARGFAGLGTRRQRESWCVKEVAESLAVGVSRGGPIWTRMAAHSGEWI
jgi:hypothetical protein